MNLAKRGEKSFLASDLHVFPELGAVGRKYL